MLGEPVVPDARVKGPMALTCLFRAGPPHRDGH